MRIDVISDTLDINFEVGDDDLYRIITENKNEFEDTILAKHEHFNVTSETSKKQYLNLVKNDIKEFLKKKGFVWEQPE